MRRKGQILMKFQLILVNTGLPRKCKHDINVRDFCEKCADESEERELALIREMETDAQDEELEN